MVVDPLRSLGQVGRGAGRIKIIVDVEADYVRLPLHGVEVKIVEEGLVAGKCKRSADAVFTGISWAVNRAVNLSWLFANIFHDVDFAAVGPAGFIDVVAQHPEGG